MLLQALDSFDDIEQYIQDVIDEEQYAYDDLNEGLQASFRGDSMLAAIDTMESFIGNLNSLRNRIIDFASAKKRSGSRKTKLT